MTQPGAVRIPEAAPPLALTPLTVVNSHFFGRGLFWWIRRDLHGDGSRHANHPAGWTAAWCHTYMVGWTAAGPHVHGYSRGRWEGDTLVVDTTNFADTLDGGRYLPSHPGALFQHRGSGETLRLTERFTRVEPGLVEYEFTMDDPQTFTRPWTARVPMQKTEDLPFEYACHEGNHGMVNMLRGARANDAAGNPELGGGDWRAGR